MYTHQVNFDKVFTTGVLEGKRYTNDYLRFCDKSAAKEFMAKENSNGH